MSEWQPLSSSGNGWVSNGSSHASACPQCKPLGGLSLLSRPPASRFNPQLWREAQVSLFYTETNLVPLPKIALLSCLAQPGCPLGVLPGPIWPKDTGVSGWLAGLGGCTAVYTDRHFGRPPRFEMTIWILWSKFRGCKAERRDPGRQAPRVNTSHKNTALTLSAGRVTNALAARRARWLCYLISSCGPCAVPSLLWLCLVIIVSGGPPGPAASSSHTLLMREAEFINSSPRPIVWDAAWLFIYSNMVCIYSDRASEGTLFNFARPSAGGDMWPYAELQINAQSSGRTFFFFFKCGLK